MSNPMNKKLAELLGKMDEKVLQAKLNTALDMLKNGDTEEIAKKLNKIDKDELLKKIDEFDKDKLKDLKIDREEIRQKVKDEDLETLKKLIGENADEIIKKFKDIIG
ncbi:MAG: membrane trafficking protein [Acetivibrionales bacterium]|jgi:hypothetical protein